MLKQYERKQRVRREEQVNLTWMSMEHLGQAFHLLALPRLPEKIPEPLHKLNPSEWLTLEFLLVTLLEQKRDQTVH
jgi:hypothetical protein